MLATLAPDSSMMRPGRNLEIGSTAVDRRTACLHQANAFREKAIADPEHHDQWIDEAIKWLERAMETNCRAAITVETDDTHHVPGVPELPRAAASG
jgi:hypothetical protein